MSKTGCRARALVHSTGIAFGVLGFVLATSAPAFARPQANASYVPAICGADDGSAFWQETSFCNSLRADVLFGRERNPDFAFGPYLQVTSFGFWDAHWGAGGSALLPISGDFPLVLSLGGGGHELQAASLEAWLFWGARTYNFHGSYSLSWGLLAGARRDLDSRGSRLYFAGAQIDGFVFALPFILAYEWARGSPSSD